MIEFPGPVKSILRLQLRDREGCVCYIGYSCIEGEPIEAGGVPNLSKCMAAGKPSGFQW